MGGVAVTPGTFAAVGAVHLAGGSYDVAWQEVGSNIFTIWSVNDQGQFVANIGNNLAGTSSTLENFETIFNQDLNGDGHVGVPAASSPGTVAANSSSTDPLISQPSDNFHFGSSAISQVLAPGASPINVVAMAGHDGFAFTSPIGGVNSAPIAEAIPFHNTTFADINAALTNHDEAFGSVTPDALHLWAHHSAFHFV